MEIRKAAVIGAGVMGGGIAAQIANAGIPVALLDRAADGPNRRAIVEGALDRLLKAEPAAFMSKANARRITLGTVELILTGVEIADHFNHERPSGGGAVMALGADRGDVPVPAGP